MREVAVRSARSSGERCEYRTGDNDESRYPVLSWTTTRVTRGMAKRSYTAFAIPATSEQVPVVFPKTATQEWSAAPSSSGW